MRWKIVWVSLSIFAAIAAIPFVLLRRFDKAGKDEAHKTLTLVPWISGLSMDVSVIGRF